MIFQITLNKYSKLYIILCMLLDFYSMRLSEKHIFREISDSKMYTA